MTDPVATAIQPVTNVIQDLNNKLAAGVAKIQALAAIIPTINGIIVNSFVQINQVLPQAGLPAISPQTLAAINKQVADSLTLVGDIGINAEGLLGIFTTFAGDFANIIASVKAQAANIGNATVTAAAAPVKGP